VGRFLLGYLADYQIPQAKGDGGGLGSPGYARAWAIPLVVFGGALCRRCS
jgi:chloride channel protein, CIC family